MRFVFGWGFPDRTPEWLQIMDRRLRGMGFVPGDYVFKGMINDEFVKKQIPLAADRREAVVREFGTNLWFQAVYLSTPPPTGATMEDIEEAKLPEFFKMWTVIDGVFRDPDCMLCRRCAERCPKKALSVERATPAAGTKS